MKKLLLSILGVLIALPGLARNFTYEYEGQTLTYTVLDEEAKTCQIARNSEAQGNIIIPDIAKDGDSGEYSVTSIGDHAFYGCSSLTSVDIPNAVTSIGSAAFRNCSNLTSVEIGNSVTSIGNSAFQDCSSLTAVDIPNSVTSIGGYAFSGCFGLTSVKIGNSVRTIGGHAFSGCSGLTTVTLPEAIRGIDAFAFSGCSGLTSIAFPQPIYAITIGFYAFSGCSGLTSIEIPYSVQTIENKAFENCTGLKIICSNSYKIGEKAFSGCTNLTSITLGEKTSSINSDAFSGCNNIQRFVCSDQLYQNSPAQIPKDATILKYNKSESLYVDGTILSSDKLTLRYAPWIDGNYSIPNTISTIGNNAFVGCSRMTSVDIPNSVTSIGDAVFSGCSSLTAVDIPGSVRSIGRSAFKNCTGLTAVEIGNSVTSIGNSAFLDCPNLETVYFNATNCTNCGNSSYPAFPSTLKNVTIGSNVKKISDIAFNNCTELVRVAYPNTVTNPFPDNANTYFYSYEPTQVSLINNGIYSADGNTLYFAPWIKGSYVVPSSITAIGEKAFYNCSAITSLVIDAPLKSIGAEAFTGCTGLTSLRSTISPAPDMDATAFTGLYDTLPVSVPDNILGLYSNGYTNWSLFKSLREKPSGSWSNGNTDLFAYRYTNAEETEVSIVGLAENADKTSLTELIVPSTLELQVTEPDPFNPNEPKVTTITLNVKSIAPGAFANLENLTSVVVSDGITAVGSTAFKGCTNLNTVTFPSTVTEISSSTFENCENLTTFNTSAEIDKVEVAAFAKTRLASVSLPAASIIEHHAYADMPVLSELVLGSNTSLVIKERAFASNPVLETITLGDGVSVVENHAFEGCSNLKSLTIGKDLKSIGTKAFMEASVSSLEFNTDVPLEIGESAFASNQALTDLIIGKNVSLIGKNAFADCPKIAKLTLNAGSNLKAIGDGAFSKTALTEVNLSSSTGLDLGANAFSGCASLEKVNLGDGVTSVGNSAFADCSKIKILNIGKDVTSIGDNAFSGATLTGGLTFVKDGALQHIGKYAFQNLRARGELSLPDKVEYIGNEAFAYPRMLTKIVLPANRNLVVCDSAFTHAQRVTELVFPETIKSIGKHAFADLQAKGMTALDIKADNIGEEAFATESTETYITKVSVSGNGTLGVRAFKGLTALVEASVSIPAISQSAFADLNKLSIVHFGDNIEKISSKAFANCAIENLTFPSVENPEAVTVIEEKAFLNNNIKDLVLGNRMKSIHLGGHKISQHVDLGSTVTEITRGSLGSSDSHLSSLTLPPSLTKATCSIYADTLNIPAGPSLITFSDNTVVVPNMLFIDRQYLMQPYNSPNTRYPLTGHIQRVVFGETADAEVIVQDLRGGVSNVHIGASVKSISSLYVTDNISFSEGVESISSLNYRGRQKAVKLPGSLSSIRSLDIPYVEQLLFADSSEPIKLNDGGINKPTKNYPPTIKEVYVGRDIDGTFTFTPWASTLEKAVIGDMATTVKESLFKDCASLTNVIMSDNVKTIGNEAFSGCSGLKVLSLSEKVTTIGDNAYSGCTNLERIVARGLTPAVGNAGFGTEVEDNVPLYVHDEVIDDYYDSDLFYPFNINPFSGNIVKEVTTENELTEEYEPGETFSIPESVSMIIDRYPEDVIDPEDPNEPVMSRSKVRRAAAAEETDLTKSFYYFSPDPDILTVDQTGTVTVRKEGEGRIWAYVLDGSDRKVEIGVNKFALEDFNHDGVIDSIDLQILVNHVINPAESEISANKADLSKDGIVNSLDIQHHVNKVIEQK